MVEVRVMWPVDEFIQEKVHQHLTAELGSGDLRRVKKAVIALEANEDYGIGGWAWSERGGDGIIVLPCVSRRS